MPVLLAKMLSIQKRLIAYRVNKKNNSKSTLTVYAFCIPSLLLNLNYFVPTDLYSSFFTVLLILKIKNGFYSANPPQIKGKLKL